MHPKLTSKKIDVVILTGGQGTRLREVISDRPKTMAEINQRPFLDILIEHVSSYGFKRFILCTGHMSDIIKDYYTDKNASREILFSNEDKPLGTGGAIKKAKSLIKSNPFLVMNGDSFCKTDFNKFYDFHINKKGVLSMVLSKSQNTQDYGTVRLDDSDKIICFEEKIAGEKSSLINAGIYLMQRDIFLYMPKIPCFSLEYDFLPKNFDNRCYGFLSEGRLIDIGTPKRYKMAIGLIGGKLWA